MENSGFDELVTAYADAKVRAAELRAMEHKLTNIISAALSFNGLHEDRDIERELEAAMSAVEAVREKVRSRASVAEANAFRIMCNKNKSK